jgi:hypothetical protein
MSEFRMLRRVRTIPVTLSTATASCATLNLGDTAGGVVSFGTMLTAATSLQMWGSTDEAGPFRRLYKADGSVADITLAASTADGRVYALPDEVFGVPWLKIASATTNSTGTVGIVSLKS